MRIYVAGSEKGKEISGGAWVEVPSVEAARSIVRGLLASRKGFFFWGCGWSAIRRDEGFSVQWYKHE